MFTTNVPSVALTVACTLPFAVNVTVYFVAVTKSGSIVIGPVTTVSSVTGSPF